PAPGRALRIARLDHSRGHAGVASGDAPRGAADSAPGHARRRGGALPGRPRARAGTPPRPREGRDRRGARASAAKARDRHVGVFRTAQGEGAGGARMTARDRALPILLLAVLVGAWEAAARL